MQTIRERHILVSYAIYRYQNAYQGFGNYVTLNTRLSNICPARRS